MRILIDGYNLIFECGLHGKRVDGRSLARARLRLLEEIVAAMSAEQQLDTTVVFDARKQMLSGQQEQDSFHQLQILYSIHYNEADELIEYLIDQHSSPKQLTVVSSDHRIQKAARRRKATPVDSGPWYDELHRLGSPRQSDAETVPHSKPSLPATQKPLLTEQELDALQDEIDRAGLDDEVGDWFNFK